MDRAAVLIQARARGMNARKRLGAYAGWGRPWADDKELEQLMQAEMQEAAALIQRSARASSGRRRAKSRMREVLEEEVGVAAVTIQRNVRGYLGRVRAATISSAQLKLECQRLQ